MSFNYKNCQNKELCGCWINYNYCVANCSFQKVKLTQSELDVELELVYELWKQKNDSQKGGDLFD